MPICNFNIFSVSTNDTGIKSQISGVRWQLTPESKTQLVSCERSPKYLLGISTLEYICAMDAFMFCDLLWFVLFSAVWYIFVDMYAWVLVSSMFQCTFLSEVSSFGKFAMKWSSGTHLKRVFGFRPLRSLRFLLLLC